MEGEILAYLFKNFYHLPEFREHSKQTETC